MLGSFVDVFRTTDITVEYLAVRGDRLALNSWRVRSGDGSDFELTGLDVTELDDDGRQCRIVTFDEDDLAAALEELERRHEELSGEAYAAVERALRAGERGIQPRRHGWRARPPDSGDVDGGPPRGRRRGGAR